MLDDANIDFAWKIKDLKTVREMWEEGRHILDISKAVKRSSDEVTLLIFDQARKKRIKKRENGVFGSVPRNI